MSEQPTGDKREITDEERIAKYDDLVKERDRIEEERVIARAEAAKWRARYEAFFEAARALKGETAQPYMYRVMTIVGEQTARARDEGWFA